MQQAALVDSPDGPALPPSFIIFLIGFLTLMPLVAVLAPRAFSFLPSVAGLLFYGAYKYKTGAFAPIPRFAALFIAIPVILGFTSALWALDPVAAAERAAKTAGILLPCLLFIAVLAALPAKLISQKMLNFIFAGFGCALLIGLLQALFSQSLSKILAGEKLYDLSWMNRGVVSLALFSVPLLAIAIFMKVKRHFVFLVLAGFAFLIVVSSSQSAQMAFIVGLLIFFLYPAQRPKAVLAAGIVLALLMITAPLLAVFLYTYSLDLFSAIPYLSEKGYAAHRMEIWNFVSHYIAGNPWIGFGMEATRAVPAFTTAQRFYEGTTVLHPHNFALQIWIEFGLIGVLAALFLFGGLLKRLNALPSPLAKRCTFASFAAVLVVAAFAYGMWQSWWLGLLVVTTLYVLLAQKVMSAQRP